MDERPKPGDVDSSPDQIDTVEERLRPAGVPNRQVGTEPTEVAELTADGVVPTAADENAEKREEPDYFIGRVLVNRYRLIRRLGTGGFGAVFEAEDTKIRKRVAVKVLTRELVCDSAIVARFRQEAESASKVGHENIVDITDFDHTVDGHHFMVMEYLDGADLGHVIRSKQSLALARILSIMIQVCRALHAAHKKGVLHRDLKPGNIFLTTRGSRADFVKLLDFGISKFMEVGEEDSRLTKTGQIIGTPLYMAPEQASGKENVDHRVDIYSLGVIMYELVTGQPPFTAVNYLGIIAQHASDPPVPPSKLRPDLEIPSAVEEIILKALAKKPKDRFSSMEHMERALVRALASIDPTAAVTYAPDKTPQVLLASQTDLHRRSSLGVWRLPILVTVGLAIAAGIIIMVLYTRPTRRVRHSPAPAMKTMHVDLGREKTVSAPDLGTDATSPRVVLRIASRPNGATVLDEQGRDLGRTPLELEVARTNDPVTYTVKLTGHKPSKLILVPSEDRSSDVVLKKRYQEHLPDDPKGWDQR